MPRSKYSLLIVLVLAVSCWSGSDDAAREPLYATVLPEPLPLPAFALYDEQNQAFTRERLLGTTTLLFFGFTHCPDICPATLQQLALARKQLLEQGDSASTSLPQIVLISVDPERDTAAKLKAYVSHFGEGVLAATGSPESITELTSAVGVWFGKEPQGDEDYYTVGHSSAVLVIGEDAALRAVFSAPHRTEYFVHDLPLLMAIR